MKRPEIDRRLAGGEPLSALAKDYGLNPSSLYRHRKNCLHLGSANAIKKEAACGSAALALLPSAETLGGKISELGNRIDAIVAQAQQEGSWRIALSGLSSLRQTYESVARIAAREQTTADHSASSHPQLDTAKIAERLIKTFDHEPEVKARIALALIDMDNEGRAAASQPITAAGPAGIALAASTAPVADAGVATSAETRIAKTCTVNTVPGPAGAPAPIADTNAAIARAGTAATMIGVTGTAINTAPSAIAAVAVGATGPAATSATPTSHPTLQGGGRS